MANFGGLPQTQLDALPLFTVDQAVQAGTVVRMGGGILRLFTPDNLQINGVQTQTVNTKICLVTPYLDLSLCNRFRFNLLRTHSDGSALDLLPVCQLTIQSRMGPLDTPSASYVAGGVINDTMNGITGVLTAGVTFAADAIAGHSQRGVWAWGELSGSSNTGSYAMAVGGNCRFIVSWSTNAVGALNVFTASLDAQT